MQQENIRYQQVWSGWLRLSHWVFAFGVLFQLLSAWVLHYAKIDYDSRDYDFWFDWHVMIGQIIALALLLRLFLLFLPVSRGNAASSHWRTFVPGKKQLQAVLQMLKFYLSFARFPLPEWYAHNPFWLLIYPLFFLLLSACLLTGLVYDKHLLLAGLSLDDLHFMLSGFISVFALFHIVTAFLHDLKGRGAFISAMVNGFRYFHYSALKDNISASSRSSGSPEHQAESRVHISVDSIKRQPDSGDNDA